MQTTDIQKRQAVPDKQEDFYLILSRFSHEIRNPISLINSELQILADSHPEVTDYTCWNDIMDNLEYTKELLSHLSDYNNAGKLSLQNTDICVYLHSTLSRIRPTMEYLGITLETEISDNLPHCPIDILKLKQALLNLLKNAMEAVASPGGKIALKAIPVSHGIHIAITDNGCGITPEQMETIFSPFVTFKKNGTGLGLSITKQIIEAHGGNIQVKSIPGKGTCFEIFLPLKRT